MSTKTCQSNQIVFFRGQAMRTYKALLPDSRHAPSWSLSLSSSVFWLSRWSPAQLWRRRRRSRRNRIWLNRTARSWWKLWRKTWMTKLKKPGSPRPSGAGDWDGVIEDTVAVVEDTIAVVEDTVAVAVAATSASNKRWSSRNFVWRWVTDFFWLSRAVWATCRAFFQIAVGALRTGNGFFTQNRMQQHVRTLIDSTSSLIQFLLTLILIAIHSHW